MHFLAGEREKTLLKQKCVVIGTKRGITLKDKNYKHFPVKKHPQPCKQPVSLGQLEQMTPEMALQPAAAITAGISGCSEATKSFSSIPGDPGAWQKAELFYPPLCSPACHLCQLVLLVLLLQQKIWGIMFFK